MSTDPKADARSGVGSPSEADPGTGPEPGPGARTAPETETPGPAPRPRSEASPGTGSGTAPEPLPGTAPVSPRKAKPGTPPGPPPTASPTPLPATRRGKAPGAAPGAVPPLTPADAFDALYAYAAPALVQQTHLLTGRRRLAHEAVVYAFHRAWERWPEVATDRDPAGWVRAEAHEYALSPWHRLRRAHRRPDVPASARGEHALRNAVLDLPPAHRRTLLLHDGLGLGLPETAAETEASTPATANRLLRARTDLAGRFPELTDPGLLHRRLTELLAQAPSVVPAPPPAVREGSERRVRTWTRAAVALTTLIAGASAFTVATAPTRYEPPLAPGVAISGVPALGGPQRLTPQDKDLRDKLRAELVDGPARLVPQAR